MKHHIEKTRSSLGELAGLSAKTEVAEKRILEAAEKRLQAVQAELGKFSNVESAPEDEQDRYMDLIAERGQLHMVIEKARKALA